MQAQTLKPWWRDWTQWVCPGPRREFSADELARGGTQPWPEGIDAYVFANVAVVLVLNYQQMPRPLAPWVLIGGLLLAWAALLGARAIWRRPSRMRVNLIVFAGALAMILIGLALVRGLGRDRGEVPFLLLLALFVMTSSAWWFLSLYRVQQIEARLKELADLEVQRRLSRRLATAQIHPHFVFNTLASLSHWVETQDPRAAPLLNDFAAYLRATLPMFERESQALGEELELVRRYLAIMKARLGERLDWSIESDPDLAALSLPPGSLLTLVENAITHGIEPSLRGGSLRVRCHRLGSGAVELSVQDQGQGLAAVPVEGLGLSNTRERLQAQYGERARLALSALEPQGCEARILITP